MKACPTQVNLAMLPQYLTCAEVRLILRCSERGLRNYYRGKNNPDGKGGIVFVRPVLGHIQRGGSILFAKAEVERFLARRTVRVE